MKTVEQVLNILGIDETAHFMNSPMPEQWTLIRFDSPQRKKAEYEKNLI